jgi:hypothetical protein
MIIFPNGIKLMDTEHKSLLHMVSDPEVWLMASIIEKARLRREALIAEWQPRLFADERVIELPADVHALCDLIMARDDYKSRLQRDAAEDPPIMVDKYNIAKFEGTSRVGLTVRRPDRVPGDATVTLFASGINLTDIDVNCILAYVQDLDDWVIGVLMGQINRGKKLMLREWQPIILADPDISTMPATENGLINMIVARNDYQNRNN